MQQKTKQSVQKESALDLHQIAIKSNVKINALKLADDERRTHIDARIETNFKNQKEREDLAGVEIFSEIFSA